MKTNNTYIALIETASIVINGLSDMLIKDDVHFHIVQFDSLSEFSINKNKYKVKVVIINPVFILTKEKEFSSIKKELYDVTWIGLIYSVFEKRLLDLFDHVIHITDTKNSILNTIKHINKRNNCMCLEEEEKNTLSEREVSVLVELVNGFSNKEIADKLNISIHTVVTHRKNITDKLKIKSLSGLTIYAITNNIVSIEDISI